MPGRRDIHLEDGRLAIGLAPAATGSFEKARHRWVKTRALALLASAWRYTRPVWAYRRRR